MSSDQLLTIATFETSAEAQVAAGALRSVGIEVFLADEAIATWFWIYSNAIGGVKLQVVESDVERAVELLEEAGHYTGHPASDLAVSHLNGTSSGNKICPACSAEVDAGLDACWSCEADLTEVPAEPSKQEATTQSTNVVADEGEHDGSSESVDALIRRAWIASFLGMFVCSIPLPLLNLYSVWLLLSLEPNGEILDKQTQRRKRAAIIFNCLGFLISAIYANIFLYSLIYQPGSISIGGY